jgi:RNA polymerase sigma-70 factor (ECF subfamily)
MAKDVEPDERFEDVLAAARTGEEWALTVFYRRYQPALLAYLRSQRPADADDLASETWIAAARGLQRFKGDEDAFRRWLFTIAHRRVLDLRRDESRRPRTVAEGAAAQAEAGATSPAAEAEAFDSLATRRALRQIASLPAGEAEVVLLRVVAGLSAGDVAAITGRSSGTVRVMQHRALRRLAKMIDRTLVTLLGSAAM